jgi:hypothetical protein
MTVEAIPKGYQIYEDRLTPAGISFRKDDAAAFARSADGWLELELEPEPSNKHDKNAIKVILGRGFLPLVRPRLINTYIGRDGYIEILFQILGPKGRKKEYENG